jgi:nitroreductase
MKETIKDILTRRSCKKYKPDMISDEDIKTVVDCALAAPTGRNRQSSIILVVKDKAVRDALSRANAAVLGAEVDPFYGAPVVLVVLAKRDVNTYLYDGSVTAENILLAAHAKGLGACWIHRAREVFESEEYKALLKGLGIEGEYEGIANCTLGVPDWDELPPPLNRNDGRVFYI